MPPEILAGPLLAAALAEPDPPAGSVLEAVDGVESWPDARHLLMEGFRLSRRAARADMSFVYVVHGDDLLGRRGAPSAMVATGLLSAARTAALEAARSGAVVNVVAVGDDTAPDVTARWVRILLDRDGPTGEVVHLDRSHIGKALP